MERAESKLKGAIDFLMRNRIRLSFVVFGIFIVEDILEGIRPHSIDRLSDVHGIIGLSLVLFGLYWRSWAAGIIRKSESLAISGPYAFMRHPLYFGTFSIAFGFSTIIGDKENIWVVIVIMLLVYLPRIKREEDSLEKRFGEDWAKYMKCTYSFFPKKIPQKISSKWSWHQWTRNREYRLFFSSLCGLVILEIMYEFDLCRKLIDWISSCLSNLL